MILHSFVLPLAYLHCILQRTSTLSLVPRLGLGTRLIYSIVTCGAGTKVGDPEPEGGWIGHLQPRGQPLLHTVLKLLHHTGHYSVDHQLIGTWRQIL